MRKKTLIYTIAALVLAAAVYAVVKSMNGKQTAKYQFATVTKGDLENTISATGTLNPITVVEVGTQVSGTLDSVYVDYNDHVVEGQLLAVLDTIMLKASVLEAEANVERYEALVNKAEYQLNQSRELFERGMISEGDYITARSEATTQKASLKSARASLDRTRQNLKYAVIRSPIAGVVIQKNIEAGQTVAASLSAPTLFKIAQDLSRMEILVDVDESDIGDIKENQTVRFEVAAYSDKKFEGIVRQVRMQPQTVSNVVTYTVVVNAENKDNLLLPGMTATVEFIIDQKNDVLIVPNKALSFKPDAVTMQKAMEKRRRQMSESNNPDSTGGGGRLTPSDNSATRGTGQGRRADMTMLWYLDDNGELTMEPVKTGLTDGTNTEIVFSRNIKEGMQVISGTGSSTTTTTTNTSSQGPPRMGPPPF